MDDVNKTMLMNACEDLESLASRAVPASWALPDAVYDNFRAHKDKALVVCKTMRAVLAENDLLRAQNARLIEAFLDGIVERIGVDGLRAYIERRRQRGI